MNYLEENSRTGRVLLPDLVRAFALLGIVLVNVAFIARRYYVSRRWFE